MTRDPRIKSNFYSCSSILMKFGENIQFWVRIIFQKKKFDLYHLVVKKTADDLNSWFFDKTLHMPFMGVKMIVMVLQGHPCSWWVVLVTSWTNCDVMNVDLFPRKFLKIGLKIIRGKFIRKWIELTKYLIKMPFIAYSAILIDLLTWFPIKKDG